MRAKQSEFAKRVMKKRILALLLIVCLVVAIPCQVSAATATSSKSTKVTVSFNSDGKPVVKWGSIKGAGMYQVKCKVNGGKWNEVANTQSTSYTHKKALVGNQYEYAVRMISSNVYSYSSKIRCLYATPTVAVKANTNGKPVVKWSKVTGATQYLLRYRVNGGSWKDLYKGINTSFNHNAAVGNKYEYAVKVNKGAGSAYGFSKAFNYYCSTPTVTVKETSGQPVVSWKLIAGATKYKIRYRMNGGSWQDLDCTSKTSYTHENAKKGNKYEYAVKVNNGVGSSYGYSSKFYYCFPRPENIGVIQTLTTLTVFWDPVPGATGYDVYVEHNDNGLYKYCGYTTKTSYTQERMWAYKYMGAACKFKIEVADGEISNDSGYSKIIYQLDPPYLPY